MNEKEQKISYTIEELEKLSNFEIQYLKSFEERLETIYPHEKSIVKLVVKLNKFIDTFEGSIEREILEIVSSIKKEILTKFDVLKEEGYEDKLKTIQRDKKKDLLDIERFGVNLYNNLSKNEKIKTGEERAYKKLRRFLRNLRKDIEEEERGITLSEHIIFLIEQMHDIKKGIGTAIVYENKLLDSIVNQVKEREVDELKNTIRRLKEINKQIKGLLRTEKKEVYRPLMSMIGQEIGGAEHFKRLIKKEKITLDDLKQDLMQMVDADETLEYLKAIPEEIVEARALRYLENFKIKAREIIERQKREGVIDELTKLFTRKVMERELDNMVSLAKQKFSFILLDIDHFKSVNDKFGHQEGDRVLKEVARIIKTEARASDFVCRYGGEEIAIVLPRTKIDSAYKLAERIRVAMVNHNFNLPEERLVTISGGVSEYEGKGTKEDVIETADKRLYKAKKSGRNRINHQ